MSDPVPSGAPQPPKSNVTRLVHGETEIYLVGTAHVSKQSVDEVRRVIDELRPDAVCVELDSARYETLTDETRWRRLDARAIVKGNRAGLFLASLLFSGFQKRLGERLGVRPGTEMLAAVEEAKKIGASVVLADRDIQATLMRCYRSLGLLDRAKVLLVLVMLPFAAPDIDEAQVEKLKEREEMDDVMATFAREMPSLSAPLITERDRYLMASAEQATGRRVVAVVGAAHVRGMVRHFGKPADRAELSVIPPVPASARLLGWSWPLLVALLSLVLFARRVPVDAVPRMLAPLVVSSALAALVACLLAGVDVVAAVVASILSPVSLVAPPIGLGRTTALVQAGRASPTPEDGARLRDDVLVPSAARSNAFVRVLLAAVVPSYGRNLGAVIGFAWACAKIFSF